MRWVGENEHGYTAENIMGNIYTHRIGKEKPVPGAAVYTNAGTRRPEMVNTTGFLHGV